MTKKATCNCANCGKTFERYPSLLGASRSGLTFCSLACRANHFAKDRRNENLVCDFCGQRFSRSLSEIAKSSGEKAYCSRACYDNARQEIVTTRLRPVGRGGKHPVNCEHCGKLFYVKPSIFASRKHHFCSFECKRLGTVTSGKHVPKTVVRKSQSQTCAVCGERDLTVLEIHHRDRNRAHNDLSNLIILCANCHVKLHKGILKLP